MRFLAIFLVLLTVQSCARGQERRARLKELIRKRRSHDHTADTKPYLHQKKEIQYKKIQGVSPKRLSLDVYYKKDGKNKKPVLIWVHGGSWHTGDKEQGVENLRDLALKNDWLFIGLNYRLSPRPKLLASRMDANRIKFPDHSNDIADAIAWIHSNIESYGGEPSRLALIGHSAGAHLVSLAGTDKSYFTKRGVPWSSLKAVVSVDIDVYNVKNYTQKNIPMIINAFGKDPLLNEEASPLLHLKQGHKYPRFFVVTRGRERRRNKIGEFISKLKEVEASVTSYDAGHYGHVSVAKAIGVNADITAPLVEFLKLSFR